MRLYEPKIVVCAKHDDLLSKDALNFVALLHEEFENDRQELLEARAKSQGEYDKGKFPDFNILNQHIKNGSWKIESVPFDLIDRRVEITGPANDAKMVINGLNSGAQCFMADLEDSLSPSWKNVVDGQRNVASAVRKTLAYEDSSGKKYSLNEKTATLLFRPRGWHLDEKNVIINGVSVSASLFDAGLFFFHNARELLERGSGPYVYLPKLEHASEAALWDNVFTLVQDELDIPKGSIKATVLVETLPAVFEMEEILYFLKDHVAGLNCGRWDYLFSFIKTTGNHEEFFLPDRSRLSMDKNFLKSYADLLVQTCHRRGAHAMGGMSAYIPRKDDVVANERALEEVSIDKQREASAGFDGAWVAHPGLVQIVHEQFSRHNQLDVLRGDVKVTQGDLLCVPEGSVTEGGVRTNISVGVQYLSAWLCGKGCVPLYNKMEDAATVEISRSQLWQWLKQGVRLEDGRTFDRKLCSRLFEEETGKFQVSAEAKQLYHAIITSPKLVPFITIPAYEKLLELEKR